MWGAQAGFVLRVAGAFVVAAWSAARAARVFWGEREALWAAGLTAFFLTFDTPSAVMVLTPDLLTVPLQFAAVGLAAAGLPVWAGVCAGVAVLFNAKGLLILAVCMAWQWRKAHLVAAGFAAPLRGVGFDVGAAGVLAAGMGLGDGVFEGDDVRAALAGGRAADDELGRIPCGAAGGRGLRGLAGEGLAVGGVAGGLVGGGVPGVAVFPAVLLPFAAGDGAAGGAWVGKDAEASSTAAVPLR